MPPCSVNAFCQHNGQWLQQYAVQHCEGQDFVGLRASTATRCSHLRHRGGGVCVGARSHLNALYGDMVAVIVDCPASRVLQQQLVCVLEFANLWNPTRIG